MLFLRRFSHAPRIHSAPKFKAFTLIELLILIGILVLLACVLLPSFAHQRRHARLKACINNLKQVGVAFRVWPTDRDLFPAGVGVKSGGAIEEIERGAVVFNFLVMSNELSTPKILVCPEDNGKTAAANFG